MGRELPFGWAHNPDEQGYTRYKSSHNFWRIMKDPTYSPRRIGLVAGEYEGVKGRDGWWAGINTGHGPDHVRYGFDSHRTAMRWADSVLMYHNEYCPDDRCPCSECAGFRAVLRMHK